MKRNVITLFVAGLVLLGCTHNEAPQSVEIHDGKTKVGTTCKTGPIPLYEKFNDGIGVPPCTVSQAATSKTSLAARSITLWLAPCSGNVAYIEYVVTDMNGKNGEIHTKSTPDHPKWSILTTGVPCGSAIVLTPTANGELLVQCAGHTWQTISPGKKRTDKYDDVHWSPR
jgi:hypothetical protein